MEKIIRGLTIALLSSFLMLGIAGCNWQLIDLTYNFTYARIYTPDGQILVEGEVTSWRDYSEGDQIQVVINEVTYLTHASLVILSTE